MDRVNVYRAVRQKLQNFNTREMQALSDETGVSVPTLYVWKKWATTLPQASKLRRVALTLGVLQDGTDNT